MPLERITLIGLGLMGGSMASALRRKRPDLRLTGVDRPEIVESALNQGMVHTGFASDQMEQALDADLIFLCTPIDQILALLPRLDEKVNPGVLISDMGSTKGEIVRRADECLRQGIHFLGGHPMAGGHTGGLEAADPLLFENAVYVLTPSRPVPRLLLRDFGSLLESVGARVLFLSPRLHDRIAAAVSHMPQLLAVSLVNQVAHYQKESEHYLKLASGGFRDMTRIASSPYGLWRDILRTNTEVITFLEEFIGTLQKTRDELVRGDLEQAFQQAARHRLSIPRDTRGFMRAHYDITVWVEDKPGVIAGIAGLLAAESINIKDIEVLKVREGDAGTFRLSLESEASRRQALQRLKQAGYAARSRN